MSSLLLPVGKSPSEKAPPSLDRSHPHLSHTSAAILSLLFQDWCALQVSYVTLSLGKKTPGAALLRNTELEVRHIEVVESVLE